MRFLKPAARLNPALLIEAGPLLLRPPQPDDYEAWASLRAASRTFLEPWEPVWPEDDLTRAAFRRRLRRYDDEIARDEAYPFLVFDRASEALRGGLTLSNIRRGVAQTASLGYWMGEAFAGRGVMTAAVHALLRGAFTGLSLRRVEAACLPENAASIRLLEKAGFQREGLARDYLCIAGRWRDHLLFARLSRDPAALATPERHVLKAPR